MKTTKQRVKKLRKLSVAIILLMALKVVPQGAIYINKVFQDLSGSPVFNPILNPLGLQWSNSIVAANGHLITVGHSNVVGQGENVYLKRMDREGNVLFQVDYNTAGVQNDYGISLVEDNNGDILVCGTTDNGTTTNYDIIILRYNSNGVLLNSSTYASNFGLNDVGTCIKLDSGGNIYIGGSCQSALANYDYMLLKYSSSLSLLWSTNYDYAGMMEVPTGIEMGSSNDVYVTGASQSSAINWDYAVARYNSGTGSFISDVRNNIPGTGFDQPLATKKDASNNIYFTGKSWNGSNYNIKTVKINSTYNIVWTATLDVNGNDDVGTTIDVDASGNVFVGGYAVNNSNLKDLICLKYNSTGGLQWQYTLPSSNPTGDAFIHKLVVNATNNHVYYVASELGNNGLKNVIVGKFKNNGQRNWYEVISDPTKNILPSDIKAESNHIYAISILDPNNAKYQTTGYSELEIDTATVYNTNGPVRLKNHLLVSFQPNMLKSSVLNDKKTTHGTLSEFLNAGAMSALIEKTGIRELEGYKCYKVFPWMVMADTMSISRSGRTIIIHPHYNTLGVLLPGNYSDSVSLSKFLSARNLIYGAEYNGFITPHVAANDPEYTNGNSSALVTNTTFPNANINVEPAWDLATGIPSIRVGIFDTGINFTHNDFGNGTFSGSKIAGGFNYGDNIPLMTNMTNDILGHGTAVADKVGAIRNNNFGVAGVAGGNGTMNSGVTLYDMKIYSTSPYCWQQVIPAPFGSIASAIVQGAVNNPTTGAGFVQNIQNHSWGATNLYGVLLESFITAYQNEVTIATSAGNRPGFVPPCTNFEYPSSYKDHMVLKIGGNDSSGYRAAFSDCAFDLDVIAPSTNNLYSSLSRTGNNFTDLLNWVGSNSCPAGRINGTSFASPFAAGTAALLLSYATNTFITNGLYPEDIEQLIQMSAKDLTVSPYTVGYDAESGYGRLNAGQALHSFHFPSYIIQHHTFNVSASTAYSVGSVFENTCLWRQLSGQPMGVGAVRRYKITGSNTHTIPTGYNFVTGWELNVGSNLIGINSETIGASTQPILCDSTITNSYNREYRYLPDATKISPLSITANGASFEGYIYEILDPNTLATVGWYPFSPSGSATFAYSLYLRSQTLGIEEEAFTENSIAMYPNPSMDKIFFKSRIKEVNNVDVVIYNALGQVVLEQKNLYISNINYIDVSGLTNGIYFANLSNGKKTFVHKIIVSK